MGCCTGLKTQIFVKNDLISDLEIKDDKPKIPKNVKTKEEISIKSDIVKNIKTSSKFLEINKEIVIVSNPKKEQRALSLKIKRIKNISKILKLITEGEIKNIHKFFI